MAIDMKQIEALFDAKFAEQAKLLEDQFSKSIDFLTHQVTDLQDENKALTKNLKTANEERDKLKAQILVINSEVRANKSKLIRQEQYSRKNNIKIYNLDITERETQEDCKLKAIQMFREKLKFAVPKDSILEAHPLPKGKKSVMIIKFNRYTTKSHIMASRKKLKSSGVSISDDITEDILQQMKDLERHPSVTSCWMWHQKLYIKDTSNQVHKLPCGQPTPMAFQT